MLIKVCIISEFKYTPSQQNLQEKKKNGIESYVD